MHDSQTSNNRISIFLGSNTVSGGDNIEDSLPSMGKCLLQIERQTQLKHGK